MASLRILVVLILCSGRCLTSTTTENVNDVTATEFSTTTIDTSLPADYDITTTTTDNIETSTINPSTLITSSTTEEVMINDVHIEEKLKNGLYRIKLAEITTNEFHGNDVGGAGNPPRIESGGKINIVDLYPSKVDDFIRRDDENKLDNTLELHPRPPMVTDFTGKLLQEKDGVITEIEKKFQLNDFIKEQPLRQKKIIIPLNSQTEFIDRRVKKSFGYFPNKNNNNKDGGDFTEFPMHIKATEHLDDGVKKIDFANTKFNTDKVLDGIEPNQQHPEFSTTKFYNSKELYNEMLHKKLAKDNNTKIPLVKATAVTQPPLLRMSSGQPQLSPILFKTTYPTTPKPIQPKPKIQKATTPTTSIPLLSIENMFSKKVVVGAFAKKQLTNESSTTITTQTRTIDATTTTSTALVAPISTTTTTISTDDYEILSSSPSSSSSSSTLPLQSLKPISMPRVLTRLQEKINALECDIQNLPQDSHVWRGNETHELMLPIMISKKCEMDNCLEPTPSWEGEAEIQSGDVLLVEINDLLLYQSTQLIINTNVAHFTQVYQVTRAGHEHCDVTEGVLLDITPLIVDNRKLVTLYDKDLTEGINLLIVVSELWGAQCIRLKVTVKSDNCGETADCSGKGVCYSNDSMEGYECQCCNGFAGPHCEEIDACNPSPCTNNGICVDLSQGHEGNAYQCLCPYGYTGKNCQYESDPCNPNDCQNGGSCVGNSTHFRCDCAAGYTGQFCQQNLNECESSPCIHGICVDQEDGFRCFCQPGFAGELCDFEYNECESNPCLNEGECIDQIGGYDCKCSKGYTGNRCQMKVDFCANKPCPEGHRCIDHGNDFSCECPGGRNGPDCNQIPRTQCNVNPCANLGTCWTSGDSFYCACRPGYTGKMCEDEFVVETVVSSSEFMVDDSSARNFNDKTFGSVVLKSPIEFHNAYIAAGVLAAAIFIVAIVVTICHCKVNQTYRKFSTRQTTFFPILGFGPRNKMQKSNRHWLSGKNVNTSTSKSSANKNHLPAGSGSGVLSSHYPSAMATATSNNGQLQIQDRPFQRHLAMNLENDMYYTVDFSESQHSPLIH